MLLKTLQIVPKPILDYFYDPPMSIFTLTGKVTSPQKEEEIRIKFEMNFLMTFFPIKPTRLL